jgi:DNA-binding MarR family transcriptional regulator
MTESTLRVPETFEREFPGCDPRAAEALVNLVRLASECLDEVARRRRHLADLSASGFEALAVLDGAGEPLPPSVIAERLLVTTASMTSLIDTLVARGYALRNPHPSDRRKVLVDITDTGREVVDRVLPVVHLAATEIFADVDPRTLERFVETCGQLRAGVAQLASRPVPPAGPRIRPRLPAAP